jgi:hypothetical protein
VDVACGANAAADDFAFCGICHSWLSFKCLICMEAAGRRVASYV